MSEAFYKKFSELIFNIFMTILVLFSTFSLLSAFLITQNVFFFYGYAAALFFTFLNTLRYVKEFRDFTENLNLLIPAQEENPTEPLNVEAEDVEDLALKVCLLYVKGYGFETIAKELNLNHPEQAKRLLRKGLTVLLGEKQNEFARAS